MNRRQFVSRSATLGLIAGIAGCLGASSADERSSVSDEPTSAGPPAEPATGGSPEERGRTDTRRTSERRAGTTDDATTDSCPLVHDLTSVLTPVTPTGQSFSYAELSPEARRIFDRLLAQDGSVTVSESHRPPEFAYTDERDPHVITYDGETYLLFAYTGPGCSFTAEPTVG